MRGRREIRDRYYPGSREDRGLLFHVFGHVPGVHTLSPFLAINGQTEEPYFRYKGGDASLSGWPAWGYGADLTYVAGTAPEFQQKGPLLGPDDLGVHFNAGGYYVCESNQIDTEDFVLEVFLRIDFGASNLWLLATRGNIGYEINVNTDAVRFGIQDGNGLLRVSASVIPCVYSHQMFFCNRDENSIFGARVYTNGKSNVGANFSNDQESLAAEYFTIGSEAAGYNRFSGSVFFVTGWKASDWFPAGAAGPVEYAAIAAERFYRLSGTWPTKAVGTWAPTVATRAFGSYLENQDEASPYTKRIYQVGSEHLRVQRAMIDGVRLIGYRGEPQTTNLISESEDLATTWAATRCSISPDAIDTPNDDSRTVVDGIVASADADTHYISITPTLENGETYQVSANAKPGDVSFLKMELSVTGSYAYFDLSSGTVETVSGCVAFIEAVGDFYRLILRDALSSSDDLLIYPAEADMDETFAGDGATVSVYVWGVQVEKSFSHTSLINTDGATATRLADALRYKGDDGNLPAGGSGRATMKVVFTEPISAWGSGDVTVPLLCLSDGGSASDYIALVYVKSEISYIAALSAASGGSGGLAGASVDLLDGEVHALEIRWRTDYLTVACDGVWGSVDTDVNIPDDLDRIDVCQLYDGSQKSGFLISDLKIYEW
jgi:hypothetical protein